jgi:hypothetical protein
VKIVAFVLDSFGGKEEEGDMSKDFLFSKK